MGSTSWAMTTNWACFFSTKETILLIPEAKEAGRGVGSSALPSARAWARATNRSFRWALDSVGNLAANLKNWWIEGGTFNRCWITARCRCNLMYLGHLTNRDKSRLGWISPPIPKFLGRRSNKTFLDLTFFWPLFKGCMVLFLGLDFRTIFEQLGFLQKYL